MQIDGSEYSQTKFFDLGHIDATRRRQSLSDMSGPREGVSHFAASLGISVAERIMRMESLMIKEQKTDQDPIKPRRNSLQPSPTFDKAFRTSEFDKAFRTSPQNERTVQDHLVSTR